MASFASSRPRRTTDEGDHEQALAHLRRAGQAERRRPGRHIQIGEALLRLRRWDEAEQAFRQVLAIDPLNPHGHLGIARALLPRRQAEAAALRVNDFLGDSLDQGPMAAAVEPRLHRQRAA